MTTPKAACVGLALVLATAPAGAQEAPDAAGLLAEAEAWSSGAAGRMDEDRARDLLLRAAATGDPRAVMRLATVHALGTLGFAADHAEAARLAAPVRGRVQELAQGGDAVAQYLMAVVLARGIGVEADPAAGVEWYRRAADQGHPWALHNLAWAFDHGIGVAADPEAATAWYLAAARAGNVRSMNNLGQRLLWQQPADPGAALGWLRQAAERGSLDAAATLGGELLEGRRLPRDPGEAVRWLREAAAAGDPRALYSLGWAHLFGRGTEQDRGQAEELFRSAAAGGSPDAHDWLRWLRRIPAGGERGVGGAAELMARQVAAGGAWATPVLDSFLLAGWVGSQEQALVVATLEEAAGRREPVAMGALAALRYDGLAGTAPGGEEVLELARRAAAAGSGQAMRLLGHAYQNGRGVPRDRQRALDWWRRADAAGDGLAQLWLGYAYLRGDGVAGDAEQGMALLERSAEGGFLAAMRELAELYDTGGGVVPPDPARARAWYERLAAAGDEVARGWLRYEDLVGRP